MGEAAQRGVGTGANQIPDMSSFSSLLSGQNGWYKLPNGIIRQFGYVANATPGAITNIAYPIPFPTRLLNIGFHTSSPATGTTAHSILQLINPGLAVFGMANIAAIVSGISSVANPIAGGFYWWAEGI